jgi:hypothetical protein
MKLDMRFGGFAGVMFGMFVVSMGKMRMMRACLVIAIRHMGGGLAMMFGGVFVMLGRMLVMFGGVLGVRHGRLPFLPHLADIVQ